MSRTAEALRWAERGFYVFPCQPNGKAPATPNGFKDASNDPERVRQMFSGGSDFNIGLVPERSGHLVVDVDGEAGEDALRDLWDGGVPATVRWTTGRGSHRLFRLPEGVDPPASRRVADELDVKTNGYVVVPHSVHPSGATYEFAPNTTKRPATLTPEQVQALGRPASDRGPLSEEERERLRAPSMEALRELVAGIPNGPEVDRDEYVAVAHAIRGAAGNDPVGLEIFLEWASRYPDADPAEDKRTYETIRTGRIRAGWDFLLRKAPPDAAERFRVKRAAEAFEATEEAKAPPPPNAVESAISASGLRSIEKSSPILHAVQGLRAAHRELEDTPADAWRETGLSPEEGSELVRTDLRRRLISYLKGDRATAKTLVNRYVPPARVGESPYTPDGLLRSADVREMDLDTPYLVEPVIPAGQVGMLVAPFSTGKSWLAIALGVAVAYGKPWLDLPASETGHVRFIVGEGFHAFPRRLAGGLVHHGILGERFTRGDLHEALTGRISLQRGSLRLDDPKLPDHLIRTIKAEGTRLVVLDTLGTLKGPEQAENDSDSANAITGMLNQVVRATGVTFLVIHHPGHTEKERARGSSAWEQGIDFEYSVRGSSKGGARADFKAGRTVQLRPRKHRDDGRPVEELGYRLRPLTVTCGEDTWETAVVEAGRIPAEAKMTLAEHIRASVQEHPGCTKSDLKRRVKGWRNSEIDEEITRLLDAGKLENEGTPTRFEIVDVPEQWPAEPPDEFEAEPPPDLSDMGAPEADDE